MRWQRARARIACGAVSTCWIEVGTPYATHRAARRLARCPAHAGEPIQWAEVEADQAEHELAAARAADRSRVRPARQVVEPDRRLPLSDRD